MIYNPFSAQSRDEIQDESLTKEKEFDLFFLSSIATITPETSCKVTRAKRTCIGHFPSRGGGGEREESGGSDSSVRLIHEGVHWTNWSLLCVLFSADINLSYKSLIFSQRFRFASINAERHPLISLSSAFVVFTL